MVPYIAALLIGMIVWAGILLAVYIHVRREARTAFESRSRRGDFAAHDSLPPFETAYLRTSGLRLQIYRWLATATALVCVTIAVPVLSIIWARLYYSLDRPAWMTEGELVHSFSLALGAMGTLVLVAALFVRLYYMRRPGSFEAEWAKEKSAKS